MRFIHAHTIAATAILVALLSGCASTVRDSQPAQILSRPKNPISRWGW